ncbi:armadillo-type protein [Cladochytrium replicatum]|nr:armadillo-type protein [Cladochytrium replicatum]
MSAQNDHRNPPQLSADQIAALVEEFYAGSTANERKAELENILVTLRGHKETVIVCRELLERPNVSPYVCFFALSVFEELVSRTGTPEDRMQCQFYLWEFMKARYRTLESYNGNKLVKVVVEIGLREYSRGWPSFMHDVYQLQHVDLVLCLSILKTVVEEVSGSNHAMSAAQKSELRTLILVEHANFILSLANEVLVRIYERCCRAATPVGPFASSVEDPVGMGFHSPVKVSQLDLLPNIGVSPSTNGALPPSPGFRNRRGESRSSPITDQIAHGGKFSAEDYTLCDLSLGLVQHLFSSMMTGDIKRPQSYSSGNSGEQMFPVVETLLLFAQLNDPHSVALGTKAMTCLNELISRNFVPPSMVEFVLLIARRICELMSWMTEDIPGTNGQQMHDLDEDYQRKFIDFLNCFVAQHSTRLENITVFPIADFLQLLFKYTFNQISPEAFLACLQVWETFLDYKLAGKNDSRVNLSEYEMNLQAYHDGLLGLVRETLGMIQFTENRALGELNDEPDLDEALSELDKYRHGGIDVIAKVEELFPGQVLHYVVSNLDRHIGMLISMSSNDPVDSKMVAHSLKDGATVIEILGRLSHLFTGPDFSNNLQNILNLNEKFVNLLSLMEVQRSSPSMPLVLRSDIDRMTVNIFETLSLCVHWLSTLYSCGEYADRCAQLIVTEFVLSVKALKSENARVAYFASSLLNSIASTVRPNLLYLEEFHSFINSFDATVVSLAVDAKKNVVSAATRFLVFAEQLNKANAESQAVAFAQYCEQFLGPMRSVVLSPEFSTIAVRRDVKAQLKHWFEVMSAIMVAVKAEATNIREIVYNALKHAVPLSFQLISLYLHDFEMMSILLEYITNLVCSLAKQVARDSMNQLLDALRLFWSVMSGDELVKLCLSAQQKGPISDASGQEKKRGKVPGQANGTPHSFNETQPSIPFEIVALRNFILLMALLIEDSSKAFDQFLVGIISYCISELQPRVFANEVSVLDPARAAFHQLIFKILLNNMTYFLGSNIQRLSGKSRASQLHEPELMALIQIMAQSFNYSNIDVIRQDLDALDTLQARCALYQKEYFQANILLPMMELLFDVLLRKSHEIVREEIIQCLSSMVTAELSRFHEVIVPTFVQKKCQGYMSSEQTTMLASYLYRISDLHTATENINLFLIDYTAISNNSTQ